MALVGLGRAPRRHHGWAAAYAVGLLAVLARWWSSLGGPSAFQDLAVYRRGAAAIASGVSPYVDRAQAHGDLVFTYPPFGAVVFVPMTWLPWPGAVGALLVTSAAAYAVIVYLTARKLGWSREAMTLALIAGLMAAPVVRTVEQGQINLILVAMVMVDVWVLPPRYRGVLIGLAAGIKIIPAVFALHALIRRDWMTVARSAATGAATVALTWAINPAATSRYWTQLLFDTSRSGGGGYPDNQSLVGVIARVVHNDTPPLSLTLPLQVSALALSVLAAYRAERNRRPVHSLLAVALGGLLASPVSWSHHWVWCVPLAMTIAHERRRLALLATCLVFLLPPLSLSPLGWLAGCPRPVWILATTLFPTAALLHLLYDLRKPRLRDDHEQRTWQPNLLTSAP